MSLSVNYCSSSWCHNCIIQQILLIPDGTPKSNEDKLQSIDSTLDVLSQKITQVYQNYSWELIPELPEQPASHVKGLDACYEATPMDPFTDEPWDTWSVDEEEGAVGGQPNDGTANILDSVFSAQKTKGDIHDVTLGKRFWQFMKHPKAFKKLEGMDNEESET